MYTFKLWLKLLKMASGRRYPDQSIENEKKMWFISTDQGVSDWILNYG